MDNTWNEAFVFPIHNKDRVKRVKNFRPIISLFMRVYKILAKFLVNRLRKKSSPLNYFRDLGGLHCRETSLMKFLLPPKLWRNTKVRIMKGISYVDFEKTCCHVDWNFLDQILEMKFFYYKWRSWILSCVRMVMYSILIYGWLKGKICASRGLGQGIHYPVLFFFFWLWIFQVSVSKSIESKIIEGFGF